MTKRFLLSSGRWKSLARLQKISLNQFAGDNPEIPWEDIVGMRNKVTHDYFGVDLAVIWKTLHEDSPPLLASVEKMLQDFKKNKK